MSGSRNSSVQRESVESSQIPPRTLTFTVDSALLKELGERLVGKAHIALAELVKNAYDADATACTITFGTDSIEVVDNGHGMDLAEFRKFWMRVGTTHKQREATSRHFGRPLTGSKGVGRLAVQFLARKVHIETTPRDGQKRLLVDVDWDSAVKNEFLTQAKARYRIRSGAGTYASDSRSGFRVKLSGLLQEWDEDALKSLATEIWALRPPFEGFGGRARVDEARNFQIELNTQNSSAAEAFNRQIAAAEDQWIAKIEGAIEKGRQTNAQTVTVTFRNGKSFPETFDIPECQLNNATWEIRIFNLSGHFGGNVKVGQAREYFSEFGGVHVYDGPFRLPYYGIQQDWLGIEFDHSHRKVKSRLLPTHFHVERALNDLPTQGRILGVVRVNTGSEYRNATGSAWRKGDYLKIQVTRDRLQINRAYEQLRDAVRRSLDYYAVCSMRERLEEAKRTRPAESAESGLTRVLQVLATHHAAMPEEVYQDVKSELKTFVDIAHKEQRYRDTLAALLGPLATAGMAALAMEHETNRELSVLEGLAARIGAVANAEGATKSFAEEVNAWIARFRGLRKVFEPLSSPEDREELRPMRAVRVVKLVAHSLSTFLDGVQVRYHVDPELYLPAATLAEWQGLFQNVITNAINAMVDSPHRDLRISAGRGPGRKAWVRVSDNGYGIDLAKAEIFFQPFQRHGTISQARRSMGLGGHGLGLTIVRMIAEGRRCRAAFVPPEGGFATTFELSWTSSND